jgi:hypothetical protein
MIRNTTQAPSYSFSSLVLLNPYFSILVEVVYRLCTQPLARYTYLPHYTRARVSLVEVVQLQVVSEARRSQEPVLGRDSPIPAP